MKGVNRWSLALAVATLLLFVITVVEAAQGTVHPLLSFLLVGIAALCVATL